MSKKYLLTKGVTEENVRNIASFLKDLNLEGFEFYEQADSIGVESYIPNDQLSDKTKGITLEKLEILIKQTRNYISKLGK